MAQHGGPGSYFREVAKGALVRAKANRETFELNITGIRLVVFLLTNGTFSIQPHDKRDVALAALGYL